jgi:hypothetical protein
MLIRDTVLDLKKSERLETNESISVKDFINDRKLVTNFIRKMQIRYGSMKEIVDASNNDKIYEQITEEADSIIDKFAEYDVDYGEEAYDMAWDKYRHIIRSKVIENIDELDFLIDDTDAEDDQEELQSRLNDI